MRRLLHEYKADYNKKIRKLEDHVLKNIASSPSYRDSYDAPYRHWYRMAHVEAHRRGIKL